MAILLSREQMILIRMDIQRPRADSHAGEMEDKNDVDGYSELTRRVCRARQLKPEASARPWRI